MRRQSPCSCGFAALLTMTDGTFFRQCQRSRGIATLAKEPFRRRCAAWRRMACWCWSVKPIFPGAVRVNIGSTLPCLGRWPTLRTNVRQGAEPVQEPHRRRKRTGAGTAPYRCRSRTPPVREPHPTSQKTLQERRIQTLPRSFPRSHRVAAPPPTPTRRGSGSGTPPIPASAILGRPARRTAPPCARPRPPSC